MRPKTKKQKRVETLAIGLPDLTDAQEIYAIAHCFNHWGYRTKKNIVCMDCRSAFVAQAGRCVCPECKTVLEVIDTKKRIDEQFRYFCIITTYSEFQVIRYFFAQKYSKIGGDHRFEFTECVQHWISPDGSYITKAKLLNGFSRTWVFSSPLELRCNNDSFLINPDAIYPKKRVIPNLKRNGFKGNFHNIAPIDLFTILLRDNDAEMLFKVGQMALFKHCVRCGFKSIGSIKYWNQIKICIRNGYIINDPSIWIDHLDTLVSLGKDISNPKYICPPDLVKAHHDYTKKLRAIELKKEIEEQKAMIEAAQKKYARQKKRFFGLKIVREDIEIVPLESVEDFVTEGDIMHHCVFTNKYYEKKDSLVLSARKGAQRLETVEVDLKKRVVIQVRGFQNQVTEYHDQIVQVLNDNIPLIIERQTQRLKKVGVE